MDFASGVLFLDLLCTYTSPAVLLFCCWQPLVSEDMLSISRDLFNVQRHNDDMPIARGQTKQS